jgi:hypothetical protein
LTREVLRQLPENNFAIASDECEWHQKQVELLGYAILGEGVSMSEDKIDAILNWDIPESVKEVQSFVGFASFYRQFIEGFSKIYYPLTGLTKKTNELLIGKQVRESTSLQYAKAALSQGSHILTLQTCLASGEQG